jgi:hypothetical protein
LTEAAHNCRLDLYDAKLKGMFDAPLVFASPNYRLPAFNDSHEVDLKGHAVAYELAFARYRDPGYAALLATGQRKGDFSLYFGEGELPTAPPRATASANYPDSGYAMLAKGGEEDSTWLCLKYGPHGGGHGHPDKLGFALYAGEEAVSSRFKRRSKPRCGTTGN